MIDNNESNQPKRKAKAGVRGVARLYAVQMMYRAEQEKCSVLKFAVRKKDAEIFLSEDLYLVDMDDEFYGNLIRITEKNLAEIDKQISDNLQKSWNLNRLDLVTKNILRLATAELLFLTEIPKNVIFNEYIEIAKAFFDDKSKVSFVNGILNKIAQQR